MNSGRSDASTSTDDFKRPLSLFYLSAPCGVLCHEPPRLLASGLSPSSPGYPADLWLDCGSPAPRAASPVMRGSLPRRPAPAPAPRLLAELWRDCGSPAPPSPLRVLPRRAPPARLLPPLHLAELTPIPAPLLDTGSEEVWWPCAPERFSLPPLLLPAPTPAPPALSPGRSRRTAAAAGVMKRARRPRPRRSPAGRVLTRLLQRVVTEEDRPGASPALRRALRTLRAAWPAPAASAAPAAPAAPAAGPRVGAAPLLPSSCTLSDVSSPERALPRARRPLSPTMVRVLPLSPARASPGLLRRRYSVPETVMRKYRLAQQSSDLEECGASRTSTPGGTHARCERKVTAAGGSVRRELARRSALLRRLWGRPPGPAGPAGPAPVSPCCCARSLASSTHELPPWPHPAPSSPAFAPPSLPPMERDYRSDSTFQSHHHISPSERESSPPTVTSRSPAPVSSSPDWRSEPKPEGVGTLRPSSPVAPPPLAYETLEIVVSEKRSSPPAPLVAAPADLDRHVAHILLESLESLGAALHERLGAGGAGAGGGVLEQEIRVRLQHAAVNTIVHLSPTRNHQIIFGNEELGHTERPPGALDDEQELEREREPEPPCGVNVAVLQQIQKLFREESPECVQLSDVDTFLAGHPLRQRRQRQEGMDERAERRRTLASAHSSPRYSARPPSDSMEVLTSDDCVSLPDSLDDPASPRAAPGPPPRRALVRSAVDVLALLPERASPTEPPPPPPPPPEAFFVRMDGAVRAADEGAPRLPERLRARLARRPRPRPPRRPPARPNARDCVALMDAMLDEIIAGIARDELDCARIRRAAPSRRPPPPAPAEERRQVRGRLRLQARPERGRRLYHKSELRAGGRCVEILEILEYVSSSQSSGEGEETRPPPPPRRSRIPVPVRESPPAAGPVSLVGTSTPVSPPRAPRSRSNSLRFRQVFDMIPEEHPPASPAITRRVPAPPLRRPRASPSAPWPRAGRRVVSSDCGGQLPVGAGVAEAARQRSAGTQCEPSSPPPPPPPAPPHPPTPTPVPAQVKRAEQQKLPSDKMKRVARIGGAAEVQRTDDSEARAGGASRSSSNSSGGGGGAGGALCGAWLAAGRRRRRAARQRTRGTDPAEEIELKDALDTVASVSAADKGVAEGGAGAGVSVEAGAGAGTGWSVTLCGGARTALPRDVEMRLRFPSPPPRRAPACACRAAPAMPAPALAPALALRASANSSRATRSIKKSSDSLPELSYRASRTRTKRSVKTRRACSLHCWLPPAAPPPSDALSVLGCGIVPTPRPRPHPPPAHPR